MLDTIIFATFMAAAGTAANVGGEIVSEQLGIGQAQAAEMPAAECETRIHHIHHARTYWKRTVLVRGCTIHVVQLSMGKGTWAQVQGVVHAVERNIEGHSVERLSHSALRLAAKRDTRVALKWSVATGVWIVAVGNEVVETPVDEVPSPPAPRPELQAKRTLIDSVKPDAEPPGDTGEADDWHILALICSVPLMFCGRALEAAARGKSPGTARFANGVTLGSGAMGTVAAAYTVAEALGVSVAISIGATG